MVRQISFQFLHSLDSRFRNTYCAWGPSQRCWPGSSTPASGRDLGNGAEEKGGTYE